MSSQSNANLTHGIRLAREGRKDLAASYLARAVQENPRSETGWLWLAACLDDIDQQRYCLGRAVQINPGNQRSQRALKQLNRPGRKIINTSAHLEITQPVRTSSSVPVTSGAMVFETPHISTGVNFQNADQTLENFPVRPRAVEKQTGRQNLTGQAIGNRLNRMSRMQILLLAGAIALLLFSLLYLLWTILAPGVSPRDIPAVALGAISGRTRIIQPGEDVFEAVASATPGATIRLMAGVHRLDRTLELSHAVRLVGAGMDSTYLVSNQAGPLVSIQGSGLFAIQGLELRHEGQIPADVLVMEGGVLELSNCRVVGGITDRENGTGGRGLVLRGTSAGMVDTCEVLDNEGDGVEIGQLATVELRYSSIHNNSGNGLLVSGEAQPRVEENILTNNGLAGIVYSDWAGGQAIHNETRANSGNGIEINGAAAPVLHENASLENLGNGVQVMGEARPILLNNRASRNQKAGVAYFDRSGGAAEENQCSDNFAHGISVNDSAEPFLTGNQCNRNREVGIDYWGVSGGVARGNECAENGLQGIAVHESAVPLLEQNRCERNRDSGIIYWDSGAGQARGNICSNNGIHGISVHDSANPTLVGNRCENNGEAGIQYSDTSSGLARENTCAGNGSNRLVLLDQTKPVLENNRCVD